MYPLHAVQKSRSVFRRPLHFSLPVILLVLAVNSRGAGAQILPVPSANEMNPTEIVWMMVARNETLAHEASYFSSLRHYHLEVRGLRPDIAADMHVQITYTAGSGKSLRVIDESGSHLLLTQVLEKLIEYEQIDSPQSMAALTPFNYNFTFDGESGNGRQRMYVFSVEPKAKSNPPYLRRLEHNPIFRGRIWIDAKDFAVVRVEAQSATNPSFWKNAAAVPRAQEKHGGIRPPQTIRTESRIRMGGTAVLTIDYGNYRFDKTASVAQSSTNEKNSSEALLKVQ
jgi:hypothetical protein